MSQSTYCKCIANAEYLSLIEILAADINLASQASSVTVTTGLAVLQDLC